MVIALILIVLTTFGGATTVAAACCPHIQTVGTEPDHRGHDESNDTMCASHICCVVAVARAEAAAGQNQTALSHVPVPNNPSSVTPKRLFRPPITSLSV